MRNTNCNLHSTFPAAKFAERLLADSDECCKLALAFAERGEAYDAARLSGKSAGLRLAADILERFLIEELPESP